MILILDFRNDQSRILTITKNGETKIFSGERGEGFVQLSQMLDDVAADDQPTGIAVVIPESAEAPISAGRMSWSTVRTVVSLANSLAFAWGVPAVRIDDSSDEDLLEAAAAALEGAEPNARVSALYDGEPHITKPK